MLGVPLVRDGIPIGVMTLLRNTVQPFSDKETDLATTFADQAVIAIENVRLFEAEQQRTRELIESLEQQTATSDVLQVISSSPGDLNPVFQTILANATRICEANFANIYRWDGNGLSLVATQNTPLAYVEARRRLPLADPKTPLGRMVATGTSDCDLNRVVDPQGTVDRPGWVSGAIVAERGISHSDCPLGASLKPAIRKPHFTRKFPGMMSLESPYWLARAFNGAE